MLSVSLSLSHSEVFFPSIFAMTTAEGKFHEAVSIIPSFVSLFDAFIIETITYKYAHGNAILLDVMVPKSVSDGKHSVNLRFHGGYLVNGARNAPELTPPRILQHAIDESVIIVTPDYRLLPESRGVDILEDIEDVWNWVCTGLDKTVSRMSDGKAGADIERVIVSGESAGTYTLSISDEDA